MRHRLFVYGLLLKGMPLEELLGSATFLGLALAKGELYDFGAFPGMIAGEDQIIGEIYEVSEDCLRRLDLVEEFDRSDREGSLYERKPCRVTGLDGRAHDDVEAYFYNQSLESAIRVPQGDYRQHRLVDVEDKVYYIAYGSNLNPKRLTERVGAYEQALSGWIPGFGLAFNKINHERTGASHANLWPQHGSACPAVAYQLGFEQLQKMDAFEGWPEHYLRTVLPFHSQDGQRLHGFCYVAQPHQVGSGLRPTPDYREHILFGYRHFSLGELQEAPLPES